MTTLVREPVLVPPIELMPGEVFEMWPKDAPPMRMRTVSADTMYCCHGELFVELVATCMDTQITYEISVPTDLRVLWLRQ